MLHPTQVPVVANQIRAPLLRADGSRFIHKYQGTGLQPSPVAEEYAPSVVLVDKMEARDETTCSQHWQRET